MFPDKSLFELDDVNPMSTDLSVALTKAVADGICSETVYREILTEIEKRRPCNVLVFGCGADSQLWHKANSGGRTVFIENIQRWADRARKTGCEVITTAYNSRRNVDIPDGPPPKELQDVLRQKWDIVFIDGPKGNRGSSPGRELPIRWVSRLPGSPLVFLHDYNRKWEKRRASQYLGKPVRMVNKTLAVWQIENRQLREIGDVSDALAHAISHGWCSEENYRTILAEIEKDKPCNVLVFGCGHDSKLWRRANAGGRTLFIEDKRRWARLARKEGCEVIRTAYESTQGVDTPDGPPPKELQDVLRQKWNIVFIDGPRRNRYGNPGRELPIRWTSRLPGSPTVFMHDYTRHWENRCAMKYFKSGPAYTVGSQLDDGTQLAVWHLGNQPRPIPYAWTYWDGARPAWIELCLETMKRNIPGISILTPTTFARLYAEHRGPDDPYDLLSVMPVLSRACQRSNIIRTWLLKTLGGMWIDADCIALSDVRELCRNYMDGKDLVTYKYKRKFSVDAIMMSPANGQVISECVRLQQEVLRRKRRRLPRNAIGPPVLRKAIAAVGADMVGVIPTELVDPARGGRNHLYLAENKLPKECVCVMLRDGTGKGKLLWTKEQWLASDCYLSSIFHRALGM